MYSKVEKTRWVVRQRSLCSYALPWRKESALSKYILCTLSSVRKKISCFIHHCDYNLSLSLLMWLQALFAKKKLKHSPIHVKSKLIWRAAIFNANPSVLHWHEGFSYKLARYLTATQTNSHVFQTRTMHESKLCGFRPQSAKPQGYIPTAWFSCSQFSATIQCPAVRKLWNSQPVGNG